MNQQINLYLPEFRKEKDWLTFPNMVLFTSAFLALLVVATAVEYYQSWTLNREIAGKQSDLEAARERTNTLVDSYGVQSENPVLAEEVARLEENLQGKRVLLQFLDGRDLGNTQGFSEYLADLSRYHVPGLQLTSIGLSAGGSNVFLRGEVSRAENVPLYLQNLRNGSSYNGKTFETLKITKLSPDNDLDTRLAFDVVTTGGIDR